jgi:ubiquinone/menaquinone biosynthesis C-methylase UbiE
MNSVEAGRMWNDNADAWTKLSRAGYDVCRDLFNTPTFLQILPDINNLEGLDIGCGEGNNTRLLARRGARMTGIDISERFIEHARAEEERETLWISYRVANAVDLPYPAKTFHFATAFMSLIDIPEVERAVPEAYRILKPGAFFQFSILHPCFDTPHRKKLCDKEGKAYAFEIGGYFQELEGEVEEWTFGALPLEEQEQVRKFKVPMFTRTLSEWLNLLVDAGFIIERFAEPRPTDAVVLQHPNLQAAQAFPYFLIVRARKQA